MSWLQFNVSANSDSATVGGGQLASASANDVVVTQMSWRGIQHSFFDGYEQITAAGTQDEWGTFTADSSSWPNQVRWGDKYRSYVNVTQPSGKQWNFYYIWVETYPKNWPNYDHIDHFTVNFGPIVEMQEVEPEGFLKWLERIGHDDGFLRVSYKMQKKMMKAVGHVPPWDPRQIAELEEKRVKFKEYLEALVESEKKATKEKLMERWGITDIPPITPELLDQIEASSRKFLEECLSPTELKWFDEHGHCKIKSNRNSNIYYIVKVDDGERVQRFINEKYEAEICIHSKWGSLPALDTLAMKVLYVKHAEEEFLKIGNITQIRN